MHKISQDQLIMSQTTFRDCRVHFCAFSDNLSGNSSKLRPVRLQIGLHTNACFCLHEAGMKNHLRPIRFITAVEPTRKTQTDEPC